MENTTYAILRTLIYADVFDYPLTEGQLWRYLIRGKTSHQKFTQNLSQLIRQRKINQKDGYYFLSGKEKLVKLRRHRQKIALKKIRLAKKVSRFLKLIPTINLVTLSGSLAMANATVAEDIDLFIITAPHTLFITRFVTTFLLDVLGVRRQPQELEVKDKICINMWLDGSRLRLPQKEQDLFIAHEIAQLKPLICRRHTDAAFLAANSWVKQFLPHIKTPKFKKEKVRQPWLIIKILETCFRNFQISYMRHRRTTEVVSATRLKFHPHDVRGWVLDNYLIKLKTFRIKP